MNEIVKREIKRGEYVDYYSHQAFCWNCGAKLYCYVKRGNDLNGLSITCDNCGCRVNLHSQSSAWSE